MALAVNILQMAHYRSYLVFISTCMKQKSRSCRYKFARLLIFNKISNLNSFAVNGQSKIIYNFKSHLRSLFYKKSLGRLILIWYTAIQNCIFNQCFQYTDFTAWR